MKLRCGLDFTRNFGKFMILIKQENYHLPYQMTSQLSIVSNPLIQDISFLASSIKGKLTTKAAPLLLSKSKLPAKPRISRGDGASLIMRR